MNQPEPKTDDRIPLEETIWLLSYNQLFVLWRHICYLFQTGLEKDLSRLKYITYQNICFAVIDVKTNQPNVMLGHSTKTRT